MPNFREIIIGLILMGVVLVGARGITTLALADEAPVVSHDTKKIVGQTQIATPPATEHIRVILPAPWQPAAAQRAVQH
jgi:hypothetical protein